MTPPPPRSVRPSAVPEDSGADDLPQSPLVLVTGKGGVGRSAVASALAGALAAQGRSVALIHPVEAPPTTPPAGERRPDVVALDRDDALANYVGDTLPGPLAAALRASRAFRLVTAATPGLAELLTIGELRRRADRYDHLVFDAPATGHLLAMLDAPGRFERAAAVGPVARRAASLGGWILNPHVTSVVLVTTGDGLAVSEVIELGEALRSRTGLEPSVVVANRLAPAAGAAAELEALATEHGGDRLEACADAVARLAARARSERSHLGRITRQLGVTPVRVVERPGDPLGSITEAMAGTTALEREE